MTGGTLDYLYKLRAKRTASLEAIQEEIVHIDNCISVYCQDSSGKQIQQLKNNIVSLSERVSAQQDGTRRRGYKRKNSWDGMEDDIKGIFNADTRNTFTVTDVYDKIRKSNAYYEKVSRAAVAAYLAGLRREAWLEHDYVGRELVYTKKNA